MKNMEKGNTQKNEYIFQGEYNLELWENQRPNSKHPCQTIHESFLSLTFRPTPPMRFTTLTSIIPATCFKNL